MLCGLSQRSFQISQDWIALIIQQPFLDPELKTYTFFPMCFNLYELERTLETCMYCQSRNSHPNINLPLAPSNFMQLDPIHLEQVIDIQQSDMWKDFMIKNYRKLSCNELHFNFSIYIDWFNPFRNNLVRRQASMGALALTCMDLPTYRNVTTK
ncbi:hypothetical protein VP01_1563g3 [Puccinia sorghi]|uniref:Uncharacterized protein n=1 Tax=Puccinia sorghi TaxID=27349 RepID=A0A0L6VI04_9BASI|nr:hypothetical protein VP01_1563g3 [Puccinia sorghi]